MSAYLCSKKHILTVANEYVKIFGSDVVAIANTLYSENNKSVNFRYGKKNRLSRFKVAEETKAVNVIELYKLVGCIDYQSCEHDGWKKSKAFKILNGLEKYLILIIRQNYGLDESTIYDSKNYQMAKWSI